MSNPPLYRVADQALASYPMIREGDSVLLGASGGKDSTALAEYLASLRRRRFPLRFRLEALHVRTELESPPGGAPPASSGQPETGFPAVRALFSAWDIPVHEIPVSVLGRLKPGRKMNCWWCSTQRRTELNNFAVANGFNKIALGHHLDDILETLLMNVLGRGELSTMPPVLRYEKYPVEIIRPLCFADTEMVVRHAENRGWRAMTCTCMWQDNSRRKEARKKLYALTGGDYRQKRMLLEALRNIKSGYLP